MLFRFLTLVNLLLVMNPLIAQEKIFLHQNWQFKNSTEKIWKKATVPGLLHSDLLDHKIILDPFYGQNENELQQFGKDNWDYKTVFEADEALLSNRKIRLGFEGLDTYAKVYLNDHLILEADNMHRRWEVDCKAFLKLGKNQLLVKFQSPFNYLEEKYGNNFRVLPASNDPSPKKESAYVRKAPFQFGWDWAPRIVTAGIWRPVYLEVHNNTYLKGQYFSTQKIEKDKATVTARFELGFIDNKNSDLQIEIYDAASDQLLASRKINSEADLNFTFEIQNPKLWWSNGLGEAHLYDVEIRLLRNNHLLDKKNQKFGIRTIELVQEKDRIGTSYFFRLNGKDFFIKGANYIPQDILLNRVTEDQKRKLVQDAQNANMNMLRVWGGGIYESDSFYDLCDEHGILVWQDFMFACGSYPADDDFIHNVVSEVEDVAKRIGNHPCLALFCGNNEVEVAWFNWDWQGQYDMSEEDSAKIWNDQVKLFNDTIPETLFKVLPGVNYVHTSPLSNWGKLENFNHSSMHYWGVWHGADDFSGFEKYIGRFNSEYGFQSFPEMSTIKKFASDEQLSLDSEVMKHHQKSYVGNERIREFAVQYFAEPKNFEDFVYLSQLTQAYGIQTAVLAHRIKKGHCMGTIYWQLNDCWPCPSWSSIDYYDNKKALYYWVKKAYEPILPVLKKEDDYFKLYLLNDDFNENAVEVSLTVKDFSGKLQWVKEYSLITKENANEVLANFSKERFSNDLFAEIEISIKGEKQSSYIYTFAEPKELALQDPGLSYRVEKIKDSLQMTITAKSFAKSVFVSSNEVGLQYSDNFFDLAPGSSKTIIIKNANDDRRFEIKSLFDCL